VRDEQPILPTSTAATVGAVITEAAATVTVSAAVRKRTVWGEKVIYNGGVTSQAQACRSMAHTTKVHFLYSNDGPLNLQHLLIITVDPYALSSLL
jgi:hypothetical protein